MSVPFEDMTPEQKRVAIARDVIAQVKAKRLKPYHLTYVAEDTLEGSCRCCALGSLLLGKCSVTGKTAPTQASDTVVVNELNRIFSREQLALIETAFDGRAYATRNGFNDPEQPAPAARFYKSRRTGSARQGPETTDHLVAIMKNIIENEGTFVPEEE